MSVNGPTSPITRSVLVGLWMYCDDRGHAFPGVREIAKRAGVRADTVASHVNLAVNEGWLTRDLAGAGGLGWRRASYNLRIPERLSGLTGEGVRFDREGCPAKPDITNPLTIQEPEREARSAHGSRFDLKFLPAEWRDWTHQQFPSLDPDRVFETFADYWKSQPGAKGRKADWLATWRNWCRREADQRQGRKASDQRPADWRPPVA
jgi:hypothetical protein